MTNRFGKTFGKADVAKAQSAAYLDAVATRLERTQPNRRSFVERWQHEHAQARNASCIPSPEHKIGFFC